MNQDWKRLTQFFNEIVEFWNQPFAGYSNPEAWRDELFKKKKKENLDELLDFYQNLPWYRRIFYVLTQQHLQRIDAYSKLRDRQPWQRRDISGLKDIIHDIRQTYSFWDISSWGLQLRLKKAEEALKKEEKKMLREPLSQRVEISWNRFFKKLENELIPKLKMLRDKIPAKEQFVGEEDISQYDRLFLEWESSEAERKSTIKNPSNFLGNRVLVQYVYGSLLLYYFKRIGEMLINDIFNEKNETKKEGPRDVEDEMQDERQIAERQNFLRNFHALILRGEYYRINARSGGEIWKKFGETSHFLIHLVEKRFYHSANSNEENFFERQLKKLVESLRVLYSKKASKHWYSFLKTGFCTGETEEKPTKRANTQQRIVTEWIQPLFEEQIPFSGGRQSGSLDQRSIGSSKGLGDNQKEKEKESGEDNIRDNQAQEELTSLPPKGIKYCKKLDIPVNDAGQADLTNLKKIYHRFAMKYHPDKDKGNEKEAEEAFKKVKKAFEFLAQCRTGEINDEWKKWVNEEEGIDEEAAKEAYGLMQQTNEIYAEISKLMKKEEAEIDEEMAWLAQNRAKWEEDNRKFEEECKKIRQSSEKDEKEIKEREERAERKRKLEEENRKAPVSQGSSPLQTNTLFGSSLSDSTSNSDAKKIIKGVKNTPD